MLLRFLAASISVLSVALRSSRNIKYLLPLNVIDEAHRQKITKISTAQAFVKCRMSIFKSQ